MKTLRWLPIVLITSVTAAVASCASLTEDSQGTGETQTGGGGGSINTGGGGAGGGSSTGPGKAEDCKLCEPTTSGSGGGGGGEDPPLGGAGGGSNDGGTGGAPGTGGGAGFGETCTDPGRKLYMSADDSSSMGSATVAREYLRAGKAPPPALIRTWEILNYYRVRYPLPADDRLGVHVHFAEGDAGKYRLQIGVQAFDVNRPPLSITFVADTSGSLVGEGILRERAAIKAIAKRLAAGDRVSFVTWANEDAELLADYEIQGPDDPTLPDLADSLSPGGGSDLHAGLVHGYSLAKLTQSDQRLNRLVLLSDGGANLGVVDRDKIAAEAKYGDEGGIHLVGIGLGPAIGYSDVLMNEVTDAGRGSYVYLDSVEEAEEVLGKRFEEVIDLAARNVQIEATIPTYFHIETFSGEGVSQDMSAIDPQHIAPGDAMVLNQVLTLLPDKALCAGDTVKVNVTWNDPLLHASSGENFTLWEGTLSSATGEPWQLLKAEAIFAYARALQTQQKVDFDAAKAAIDKAKAFPQPELVDVNHAELDEIATLLESFPKDEMK